jgi:hypothetical protein
MIQNAYERAAVRLDHGLLVERRQLNERTGTVALEPA